MGGQLRSSSVPYLYLLFFLSGVCGLIYEIAWSRLLVVVFGTTVLAASTVLSAFMGGLALGSFLFGIVADRSSRPLFVYGLLELGIGLFALLFPALVSRAQVVYPILYRAAGDARLLFAVFQFLLCFVLLLIPTTLMGGTFPVLVRSCVRERADLGGRIGALYGLNTLGATAGAFVATFVLIEGLGVRESTYAAAFLNGLIAIGAFGLSRRDAPERRGEDQVASPSREVLERRISPAARIAFWGFALSGFAALGYEVAWTRVLVQALANNTAYAFGTILVAFLSGIGLGGLLGARLTKRGSLAIFGGLELGIGLLGILSVAMLGGVPALVRLLTVSPRWGVFMAVRFVVSVVIMLIPTVLMGATLPVVGHLWAGPMGTVGRRMGEIYAINTVGGVLGAFIVGFVAIPLVGTGWSIQILAVINLVVGAIALLSDRPIAVRVRWAGVSVAAALVLVAWTVSPARVLRRIASSSERNARLLYYRDRLTGTVTVHRYRHGGLVMKINGGGQVSTGQATLETFVLLGHLPMLLHERPEEVLVISLGGGIALNAVAQHDARRIDCVEIVPDLAGAARYFRVWNGGIVDQLDGSRIHLITDDARNFLLKTDRKYDVITGDATHPGSVDSWVLYTREFYDLCKRHLKEEGLMAQWVPLHGLSVEDYRMALRTFMSAFPHTSLWLATEHTVLLGSLRPLKVDIANLRGRMEQDGVEESLAMANLHTPFLLLSCFVMDERFLPSFVGPGKINTDDHPYISFYERRRRGTGRGIPNLQRLARARRSPFDLLSEGADLTPEDGERLRRYEQARGYTIRGHLLRKQRAFREAIEVYRRALRIEPGEKSAAYYVERLGGSVEDQ